MMIGSQRLGQWAVERWLALAGLALVAVVSARAAEPVVVDFGVPADPPLVRKFGFANSCAVLRSS